MRPKRRVSKPIQRDALFSPSTQGPWTLNEKALLEKALKRCRPDDYVGLQKALPMRSKDEIRLYIEQMKRKFQRKHSDNTSQLRRAFEQAPIEKWINNLRTLIYCEPVDYSTILSDVMSVASTLEPHLTRSQGPRYEVLYDFIKAALSGNDCRPLVRKMRAVDAGVLLMLMEDLVIELRKTDKTLLREMMVRKQALLGMKVEKSNMKQYAEARRIALEEDVLQYDMTELGLHFTCPPEVAKDLANSKTANKPSSSSDHPSTSSQDPSTSNQTRDCVLETSQSQGSSQHSSIIEPATSLGVQPQEKVKRKRGRPRKGEEPGNKINAMYTLNPYAIPVKYLVPKKKNKDLKLDVAKS